MSTRSYVGIIKNGQVKYGYHHCDSHLESRGVDLFKCIKTKADAYEQINEFAEMDDMGDTISKWSFFAIPEHDIFIEFCYGFDVNDCQWYVSSCHFADASKMYKLTDIVKDDKEMACYADMYTEQYRDGIIKEIRENIKSDDKVDNVKSLLWQLLEPHIGHTIEIAKYGNDNISLEDMDTGEVIFDTDLYDLVGLDDGR